MPKLRNKLTKVIISVADDHPFAASRDWETVTAARTKRASKQAESKPESSETDKD